MVSHINRGESIVMLKKENIAVVFAGQEVLTLADVEYFTQQDRVLKAAQALGICWGVALLCAVVPIIHFVITPLALVMGPLAACFVYFKVKKLPKRVEGRVSCGHCQALTDFRFVQAKPPLFEACGSCKTGYEVLWPPRSPPHE